MYGKAQTIFYGLAAFVLATSLFVMRPSQSPEVITFQNQIKDQFSVAVQQTIGDQPWFGEVGLVIESIAIFYEQATTTTIALIEQPEMDADLAFVFGNVYTAFAQAINPNQPAVAYDNFVLPTIDNNFMSEDALYNTVPYREIVKTIADPIIAGVIVMKDEPVNSSEMPWVTMKDALTGQLYCLAIYNGEANQYLGPCKYDYK